MAMVPANLESAMQATIFDNLKALQESKIPPDASASQKADIEQTWQDLATAVSKAAADIVAEVLNAQVQVTVPPGSFLVAATAGVPNPAPVPVSGIVTG